MHSGGSSSAITLVESSVIALVVLEARIAARQRDAPKGRGVNQDFVRSLESLRQRAPSRLIYSIDCGRGGGPLAKVHHFCCCNVIGAYKRIADLAAYQRFHRARLSDTSHNFPYD